MIILQLELKQWWKPTVVWALVLATFLVMVVAMYPMMEEQMAGIIQMIQGLGVFTKALKLDDLMIDRLIGFYSMEMENILGISGAVFAGYVGGRILAKEELLKSSEFLLSHPIKRSDVYLQKLLTVLGLVVFFNAIIAVITWFAIAWTNQSVPLEDFVRMHLVMIGVHLLIACLSFALSVFFANQSLAISLTSVFILYILNILINIDSRLDIVRWVTPFQFAYASDVLNKGIDFTLVLMNAAWIIIFVVIGLRYYCKKDL